MSRRCYALLHTLYLLVGMVGGIRIAWTSPHRLCLSSSSCKPRFPTTTTNHRGCETGIFLFATETGRGGAEKNTILNGSSQSKKAISPGSRGGGGDSIGYHESDAPSKGIVFTLTNLINGLSVFRRSTHDSLVPTLDSVQMSPPPCTPHELLQRIRNDYVQHNYLWTGHIDISAYDADCQFVDPTIRFVGTAQFVKNVNNLQPALHWLTNHNVTANCQSILLHLELHDDDGYIQSRWNMVGTLSALPWKPRVDVIGRTQFFYQPIREDEAIGYQVVRYEEKWEIPAYLALLQLVTPAGTIKNGNTNKEEE